MKNFYLGKSLVRILNVPFGARFLLFSLLLFSFSSLGVAEEQGVGGGAVPSVADVVERVSGSVVKISAPEFPVLSDLYPVQLHSERRLLDDFFSDFVDLRREDSYKSSFRSLGSGFVVDELGLVVTNRHILSGAKAVFVNFQDGSRVKAEVVGWDDETDLALLRVATTRDLKPITFADSDAVRVGETVLAIGNPLGSGPSVSLGIVSARGSSVAISDLRNDFIQTDAAINRSNSGGPLLDMSGRAVGVNSAIYSDSSAIKGVSFAIASRVVEGVISQLLEFGNVQRAAMGVRVQRVTDMIASALGMQKPRGVLVRGVEPDGPADKAGIQVGDVLVAFSGHEISAFARNPLEAISNTRPGKEVEVTVLRAGKEGKLEEKSFQISLISRGEMEVSDSLYLNTLGKTSQDSSRLFGAELATLDTNLRRQFNISRKIEGVAIILIDSDSLFVEKGVMPGSVIVEVSLEKVQTPAEITERIESDKRKGRKSTLLLVSDGLDDLRFIAVPIEE